MKYSGVLGLCHIDGVAPFTGAWIEMRISGTTAQIRQVAPFTGAWIEIPCSISFARVIMSLPSRERGLKFWLRPRCGCGPWSLPSRERGLKFVASRLAARDAQVAPFTGAWIEIDQTLLDYVVSSESLPSRERGLKFLVGVEDGVGVLSLPSRERGLKLCGCHDSVRRPYVAPFTGAWIEIGSCRPSRPGWSGRSLHGSVD